MIFFSLLAASLMSGTPATSYPSDSSYVPTAPGSAFAELQAGDVRAPRASDLYLRLSGGLVTTTDSNGPTTDIKFDEGYLGSVGLGKRLGAFGNGFGFLVELDGVYTDQDGKAQGGGNKAVRSLAVIGVLLDGIVDLHLTDRFSLYAGAGVGAAWLNVDTDDDATHDFHNDDGPLLAWTAKAGLAWHVATNTSLHLGYRFLNIDDAKVTNDFDNSSFALNTEQHALEVGVVFGM